MKSEGLLPTVKTVGSSPYHFLLTENEKFSAEQPLPSPAGVFNCFSYFLEESK